mmetsp:Transcript_19683/g.43883  ORF Transcript_19683/g.43883 Transcript_19683/m.43883 type:complete len:253 (-) Transcript_19683:536-1294(-)
MDVSWSESFFITLATAISKSSCVTWMRRSLSANMPASVHTPLHSAPDELFIFSAIFVRSMPLSRFMRRLWMPMMSAREPVVGLGNSIFRSMRPGRSSAASRMSMRLVAMMTLTLVCWSKPSIWLSSSSRMRCTSRSAPVCASKRFVAMASISSMNTMAGEFSRARRNTSLTMRGPSPRYFCTNSLPTMVMKAAVVALATAFAIIVFPVPGGPYISTPLGGSIPICLYSSNCVRGSSTASRTSCFWMSLPPMS